VFFPLAVGEALGTPVLLAATRRYSTTAQRSISFSIIYMVMNVGYIAAGWIFDYVRDLNLRVNIGGFEPTTYQQLFIVSLVFEILAFFPRFISCAAMRKAIATKRSFRPKRREFFGFALA